ncbi:MAG: hypothetical protein KDC87_16260 [Planctomycetes bacterium]|nr:hypothetical protein [Planctomycetota bacterium]MCB9868437.1 hypothetical protein [Planctomycetota bacterium]
MQPRDRSFRLVPRIAPALASAVFGTLFLAGCAVLPPPEHCDAGRSPFSTGTPQPIAIAPQDDPDRPPARGRRRFSRDRDRDADRPYHPSGNLTFGLGVLDFEHRTFGPGANLDGKTDAGMFQVDFEAVRDLLGGGATLRLIGVDDDLHEPGTSNVDTSVFDFYPHFTVRPVGGEIFRMPIRVGPYFNMVRQELAGSDLDYYTVGVRVQVEPELDLFSSEDVAISLYGHGEVGGGSTAIDSEQFDEWFSTDEAHWGWGAGVRVTARRFHASFGYLRRKSTFDASDVENTFAGLQFIKEADFEYDGFLMAFGVRW